MRVKSVIGILCVLCVISGSCCIYAQQVVKSRYIDLVEASDKPMFKDLVKAVVEVRRSPHHKKHVHTKLLFFLRDKINKINLIIKSLKNTVNILSQEEGPRFPVLNDIKNLILSFYAKIAQLRKAERDLNQVIIQVSNVARQPR